MTTHSFLISITFSEAYIIRRIREGFIKKIKTGIGMKKISLSKMSWNELTHCPV